MFMNKNIVILGCQRAGKTTLTNMLASNSKYTIFSGDALVFAFSKSMPELGIDVSLPISQKSKLFAPFLASYFKAFCLAYPSQKFLIESCQILPHDLLAQPFFKECQIVCLGYPNATVEEMFSKIRYNDKLIPNSYSAQLSDNVLKKRIASWIAYSQRLQAESNELGIPFFETNNDRMQQLSILAAKLQNNLER